VGDKNGVKGYDHQSVVRINSGEVATATGGVRGKVLGRDSPESSVETLPRARFS